MNTRLSLSEFPAAGAFLRAYADPAQWAGGPMAQWFNYNPHDAQCYAQRIEELRSREVAADDSARVEAIVQQQVLWGGSEQSVEAARSLADPNTFTVVTGQQAGLFGGPLYSQLKAVAAIKLARQLKQRFPDCNFIPVFWIASADSDFDEVRKTYVFGRMGDVVELALPPAAASDDNLIVAQRDVSDAMAPLVEQLAEQLGGGEHRDTVLESLREQYSEPTLNESFGRWMAALFQRTELVLVEPSEDIRRAGPKHLLADELSDPGRFAEALNERNAALERVSFAPQVQTLAGDTNVFQLRDGRRLKISNDEHGLFLRQSGERLNDAAGDIQQHPENYFHSALLNPLYQDALLKPVAFLGGAAELAYRAQSSALADLHGMRLAPAFLRATATLLPQKSADALDELGWELTDLYRPLDDVLKAAAAIDKPEEIQHTLEQYFATIQGADEKLRAAAIAFDPALEETFETLRGNLIRHLDKLDKKITGSLKQRSEPRLRRVTALRNMVYPRGEVQERELSLLSFLPRGGFDLLDELLERLEFPSWEHQVVVL